MLSHTLLQLSKGSTTSLKPKQSQTINLNQLRLAPSPAVKSRRENGRSQGAAPPGQTPERRIAATNARAEDQDCKDEDPSECVVSAILCSPHRDLRSESGTAPYDRALSGAKSGMPRYHPQSRSVGREPPLLRGTLGIDPGIDDPAYQSHQYQAAAPPPSTAATMPRRLRGKSSRK